jgi:GDP/UDP-N,N'-diacetylbacillosamine 2-epimerase (hydrolysing)
MGEEPWRIFNVGAPQLDDVVHGKKMDRNELAKIFGVDFDKPVSARHPARRIGGSASG